MHKMHLGQPSEIVITLNCKIKKAQIRGKYWILKYIRDDTEAARKLGVSRNGLSRLVNGYSHISPEMAIRLEKAFGGGAEAWHRLQTAYDFAQAMQRADEIKVESLFRPNRTFS